MERIKPRFEFRAFAQNFGIVEEKMRRLSSVEKIRESSEIYIMSAGNNASNTKVRDKLMDIKVFVKEEQGLQQWAPRMKGEFPMKTTVMQDEVFPAFGVQVPDFKRDEYSVEQFIEEIIRPHNDLVPVHVFKKRFAFTINNCIAEIADILINGAYLQSVNVESVNIEAVLAAKEMLSLNDYENVNYLLAIKRVIGMEPMPMY